MKQERSKKIDMEKEFGLEEIGAVKVTPLTPDQEKERQLKMEEYIKYVENKLTYNKKSIKTPLNAEFFLPRGEMNTKPSRTVPDQTMGIREILSRYAQGLPVGVKTPIYDGEENDLPDPRTLDLVDRAELAEAIRGEISVLNEKVNTKRQPKPKEANLEETKPI